MGPPASGTDLRQRFLAVTSTNNALINKQYVTPLLVRGRRSYFFETIANAVKRLDHIELDVVFPELYAQPLDVAVDGPVVHILLIVIGCCAAFDAFDDRMFACLVVPN